MYVILPFPHHVIAILMPLKLTDQPACTYLKGSNWPWFNGTEYRKGENRLKDILQSERLYNLYSSF